MKRLRPVPMDVVKTRLPKHISLDESTYVDTHTKARFVDDEYGEFWARPQDVFKGSGHRQRGNDKVRRSKRAKVESVVQRMPAYVKLVESSYGAMSLPAEFVDSVFGSFIATPKQVVNGKVHRDRALAERRNVTLTPAEVQARLPPYLTLVVDSYINTSRKAVFIDEVHGEFSTVPNNILCAKSEHPLRAKENRKRTCLEKYGVPHPMGCPEVFAKARKSMRQARVKSHWKTGELLTCVGSYEAAVVDWLNKHSIDFHWQLPFSLPNGRFYYCDLYLPEQDKYVEIKGWWMQDISLDKWRLFCAEHENAELWDRDKLRSLGIKVK